MHHKKISSGFTEFKAAGKTDEITIDRGGYIWTLAGTTGGLRWYKYDATAGDFITGSGKIVDMGWDRYDAIYAGDKGVLYGRSATDGKLYRSRYDVTSQRWIERHVLESAADWSDSKTITSFGGDTLFRVKGNGSVTYYRFDEGIRDFPVYNKQLEASGWAAFTSVSGAPDACRIDVNHTPASPSVPLENYSRASVMQSSAGSLELAYTDNIGRLVHGRMPDAYNINGVLWTTISGNEAFTGQPTLAEHTDGRVVVSGHNTSGSVRQTVDDGPADHALLVDDEGAAHRAALLLVEDAVRARGLAVRPEVREQRVLQALLLGEDAQGVDGVVGDGEQLGVVVDERRQLVTERAELARAHAGEGEGIEEEHHVLLAAEVGEAHGAAVVVLQLEVRGLGADLDRHDVHPFAGLAGLVRSGGAPPYADGPPPTYADGGPSGDRRLSAWTWGRSAGCPTSPCPR